ncbi:MAG: integrase [Chlamydiota bacterium]|nr:integrase [Chlamydiota bacterium]
MKTAEPGIEKIEGKRGTVYRVQIRKKGHKHQSRTFTNFRQAKKWKYDTFNALSAGDITDTATMRRTLLSHIIQRYIENILDPSSSNYKTRLGQLKWWEHELGHCIITNITEDVISESLDNLKKTPDRFGRSRKNATINRYATTLSCVLEKAFKEWRLIQRNPVRNLKKKSEPKQKKKVLTFSKCQTLLSVCKEHPSKYALALVSILLCTGFRKGEVLSLRRKHVSLEKEYIYLETSKNSDSRTVPLVDPALRHLKNYLLSFKGDENDFIFPGRNKEKPIDFRATWRAILKKADIHDFTTHCTRYTTISLLSELKVPVNIIAQIVGHRTIDMTMHYTVPSLDFMRQELQNLGSEIT